MKRIIKTTLATMVSLAIPALAHAQSSVTLYGVIDEGITYVSNAGGSHLVKMDDSSLLADRWGLKGREDLGGGLAAIFALESGFSVNNGALYGSEFGRQAWVGLDSRYGKLTMGRQYDFSRDYMSPYGTDGWWLSGYGVHQGALDREVFGRFNNSVRYESNDIRGFQFGGMYSFSNAAGNFHDGSGWSVGARYANSPFSAAVTYTYQAKPTIDPYELLGVKTLMGQTTVTYAGDATTDPYTGSTFDLQSIGTFGVGAQYKFGPATVIGNFTDTVLKGIGATAGHSPSLLVYEIGALYRLTPFWTIGASYQHSKLEANAWNEYAAAVDFTISKRTWMYLTADYLRASGGVDPVIGASFTPSRSSSQLLTRLALVHEF
ncbi:outer membrane protein (porin) [Burkholderia sp. Ch1-1]|uniref:Outer membrane protein (Porin) n=1 Tax=Paraburkholderia dioscoreae TaxID=2604047 RepID=A0A5Q4ZCF0_9BURK|nr:MULTISPECIES: porin [Paraburkholderia]EIF28840.1 outer membrane protein (porin) [Burkholderia sp. Ch1-1]MDR8400696.1 porin [Paraburkholderia sp. USG1]VVD26694.1 Outer membrane protein (Porin) [Paraburkholderia dioscoreae]